MITSLGFLIDINLCNSSYVVWDLLYVTWNSFKHVSPVILFTLLIPQYKIWFLFLVGFVNSSQIQEILFDILTSLLEKY